MWVSVHLLATLSVFECSMLLSALASVHPQWPMQRVAALPLREPVQSRQSLPPLLLEPVQSKQSQPPRLLELWESKQSLWPLLLEPLESRQSLPSLQVWRCTVSLLLLDRATPAADTGDCPPAVLLGLDVTQSPGLRGPTNFVGIADKPNMKELDGVLAEQAQLHR